MAMLALAAGRRKSTNAPFTEVWEVLLKGGSWMERPPNEPTLRQELQAIIHDGLGLKRPAGAKTMEEWRRETCLFRFGQMLTHMAEAIDS